MSHTITVSGGHVTVTCTLCDLTIVVPEGADHHVAAMQGLELFLHHRINHHEGSGS